jgi:GntR family transcriptional repressor for pyruvate dehydrogenase complex
MDGVRTALTGRGAGSQVAMREVGDTTPQVKTRPSTRRGRSSEIALEIQRAIYDGKLAVGQRLPNERELGREFGVSRSTLREAIRLLEAQGVVEVRRGVTGGTYVIEPGADRVGFGLAALIRFGQATTQDFAEFRRAFEPETARLAALRITAEQRGRILAVVEALRDATDPRWPWERFMELDIALHEEIANASHNPIRVAVMLGVHEAFRQTSMAISRFDNPAWRAEQFRQLELLADAIVSRKAALAKRLMMQHVDGNVALAAELLDPSAASAGPRHETTMVNTVKS